ncbi:hypothetical protein [Salipiger thiooxidans]|uniref:hypothetical protein n=1 Tax=Salipiger thiooxidans TaxID=282683 RepID=UPI001CD68395|nr:hypothetical protein [Salipiger thiooxidans]MCA0851404.1 hypothetical protein [Salipiger thiooxidans]
MIRQISPTGRMITAATAIVLCRGGLVDCTDLVRVLDRALQALGERAPPAEMVEIAEAGADVVEARLDADVVLFDRGRDRLGRALARYWAARARDPTLGGSG